MTKYLLILSCICLIQIGCKESKTLQEQPTDPTSVNQDTKNAAASKRIKKQTPEEIKAERNAYIEKYEIDTSLWNFEWQRVNGSEQIVRRWKKGDPDPRTLPPPPPPHVIKTIFREIDGKMVDLPLDGHLKLTIQGEGKNGKKYIVVNTKKMKKDE